jgi:hypothetical protein
MSVLTRALRASIGIAAFAVSVSACGTSSPPVAEPAAADPTAERPPALACKMRSEMIIDHFGLGRGAGSPEEAATRYQAPGSTLVVDRRGDSATIHVVSADGDETLAILGASILNGWRIDTVESCPDYKPHISANR